MINGIEKIGVGIVTMSRESLFEKLVKSLEPCVDIDKVVVVQDISPEYKENLFIPPVYTAKVLSKTNLPWSAIGVGGNLGVGKCKNKCLKSLLDSGCDHIFLIEDDIFIKDPKVFEKYIETSKITGIQHFNYSHHGRMNKTYGWGVDTPVPNPRVVIDYGKITLPLYPHCVGAFSYYSKKCLETAGLIDERYYNACEHVDHTLEIIKKGIHPPFWYFADIEMSWTYLGDEEWSREKSTISSNPNHKQMMIDADKIFVEKHGHLPGQTALVDRREVGITLREIQQKYGINNSSV